MFVANLTVPGTPNPGNYAVYVNLTTVDGVTSQLNMTPVNAADTNLSDGKAYNYTVPVGDRIYLFWFLVTVRNGTSFAWFESPWQVGPITAGYGTFYGFALYYGTFALILPMSLYFILLMLFWWTSRARMERQRLGMATPAETDTGFMCTNCGADVPAAAAKCPKCAAGHLKRAHRLTVDAPLQMSIGKRRYYCAECGWTGWKRRLHRQKISRPRPHTPRQTARRR